MEFCEEGLGPTFKGGDDEGSNDAILGGKKKGKSNSESNSGTSSKQSKSKQKGIGPLLSDLLGADRIIETYDKNYDSAASVSISKAGLQSFSSCANLKKVLMDHGLEERLFRQIMGLS